MLFNRKSKNTARLPGFGITLGLSLTYMSLLVLIPLSALILFSFKPGFKEFSAILSDQGLLSALTTSFAESFKYYWAILSDQRVTTALKISFGTTFLAACINAFFGLIIAWVLARYSFYGKRIVDALIDLPFAIPTAVTGISLTAIFAPNGLLGEPLQSLQEKLRSFAPNFDACPEEESCFRSFLENIDLSVAYSKTGIVIALVFIGLPFVVRSVQPVIEELDRELEEAASSLGANFFQIFRHVIFPSIYPALLTGFALAFARGVGEYGSVIFISSNMPYETEIVPLLIVKKLMEFDYEGASAIGVIMLVISFALLLLINFLQRFSKTRGSK
ncbi:MAG: sulfate ABC transporter permease subunit CysT [Helicobacteraceae bacterium]|jgi:sulfate transport system permease protein|nr:sulfate ABC transporter permease subunit CysT [Helicobacteraceae bacterium]